MTKKSNKNSNFEAVDLKKVTADQFDVNQFKRHLKTVANQDIEEVLYQNINQQAVETQFKQPENPQVENLFNPNFTASTSSLVNLLNPTVNEAQSDIYIQTLKFKYQPADPAVQDDDLQQSI